MNNFFSSHAWSTLWTGVVAALVSGGMTYYGNMHTQTRQIQLENVVKFGQSSDQVVDASRQFLTALNGDGDIAASRKSIESSVSKQYLETQTLKNLFPKQKIVEYEKALQSYNEVVKTTNSPQDIKMWIQSFDRVVTTKIELTRSMYNEIKS